MGQENSAPVDLEKRVEEPADARPCGLALIAHGRLGGDFNSSAVRKLAEYLRDQRCLRVVTWNARGIGNSGGGNEWSNYFVWAGGPSVADYNGILHDEMQKFGSDFPEKTDAQLFLCGYSAGAMFAACARPPKDSPTFSPPKYILISYPVELNPLVGLHRSGSYFRALESLVRGHGWENLPAEFEGSEPPVGGVLTITGSKELGPFYGLWLHMLGCSDHRKVLKQVVVDGAGHDWADMADEIPKMAHEWLETLALP